MSKREKVQRIKELATTERRNPLTEKEKEFLKARGYDLQIFLNSSSNLVSYSTDSQADKDMVHEIARKTSRNHIHRRIITFKGN